MPVVAMIAGLDLAAKEENKSGICFYDEKKGAFISGTAKSDEEILKLVSGFSPEIIAIDAPLSLPRRGSMRKIEHEMMRRNLQVFPIFNEMKELAERAIQLKKRFEKMNIRALEVHPTSSAKMLAGETWMNGKLKKLENEHERDAFLACITALFYKRGKYLTIGGKNGKLILPRK